MQFNNLKVTSVEPRATGNSVTLTLPSDTPPENLGAFISKKENSSDIHLIVSKQHEIIQAGELYTLALSRVVAAPANVPPAVAPLGERPPGQPDPAPASPSPKPSKLGETEVETQENQSLEPGS